ncbi:MAG: ABC transporter ATP-binding protein [Anaerolineaceae bacterium]|nr:ABC transporter ATP-binding protein [Anaerolineaceae bacterium]
MASVELRNLRKTYDKKNWAVDDVSLTIPDGELLALLGPSGCGKSSTMRMIAGLEELTSGEIYFDGQLINRVPPQKRNVAMVFETYALYPTLTVYENLAFPLRSAGWAKQDITKRVDEIVDILGVQEFLTHKPRELSSGQSQLVGLGRALMRQPNVFVMDEPISHLDTRLRSRMRSYIKRLHLDLGYTMLYVTHDQEEAMALADRIAIMERGKIVQAGTPQEIFHDPINMYVGGFVGEPPMNFLACQAERQNDTLSLSYKGHAIPLPGDTAATRQDIPRDVVVGVRPFYIDSAPAPSDRHTIPADVFVVEAMGDSAVISVNAEDTRLQVVTESHTTIRSGDTVWLGIDPAYMLLFDQVTGARL